MMTTITTTQAASAAAAPFPVAAEASVVAAETVVDAQVGYEFQSGILQGLSILAQVNNLTDEPFKTFENGDERRTIDFQKYGRTFLVGVNYRF